MSIAHAPAAAPVVIVCPEKTYADGREIYVYGDRVEIVFYANLKNSSGLEVRHDRVCIVITREVYERLLCEIAPTAMEALTKNARCTAMN